MIDISRRFVCYCFTLPYLGEDFIAAWNDYGRNPELLFVELHLEDLERNITNIGSLLEDSLQ